MSENIRELMREIEELKEKLKEEIKHQEESLSYKIERGKVTFEKELLKSQKEVATNLFRYIKEAPLSNILSAPIIYMMIIPAVLLDIFLFIYVKVIFGVYGFPSIKRGDYIVFDRQYLGYLNPLEKLNCVYCSYFNGLINYTAAVAARTELYFCPIRHAKKIAYVHEHYYEFLPYGDANAFKKSLNKCRDRAKGKKS
jgi:hypothetical protein